MKINKLPLRLTLAFMTVALVAPAALRAEATGDTAAEHGKAEQSADKKAEQAKKRAEHRKALLEKYDVNHNGKLDPEERAALKADQEKARSERAKAKAAKQHAAAPDSE